MIGEREQLSERRRESNELEYPRNLELGISWNLIRVIDSSYLSLWFKLSAFPLISIALPAFPTRSGSHSTVCQSKGSQVDL